MAFADETGLPPNIVEKDYVLGWLLAAINSNPALSQSWVFKGGTCLKKCYFETYRFSEDLDFTLRDQSHVNEAILKDQFTSISEWLYQETGIEIPVDRLVFDFYTNPRGRQFNDASITNKVFVPKFQVELRPSGISVPIVQKASVDRLGLPTRPKAARKATKQRSSRKRRPAYPSKGPTYIYRCPMCNKRFKRKTQNVRLNPHKSKDGWPCSGRVGYYEDTIWT